MLEDRPTSASCSCIDGTQLINGLRAGVLVGAAVLLCACGTSDPMETKTLGTEASATPDMAVTPVAMIEPTTGTISELPAPVMAEANPVIVVPEDVGCTVDAVIMQQRMLQLINEARLQPRACGNDNFGATQPLSWNSTLEVAARTHSEDMAEHDFFSHSGSDGSSSSDRATVAGYQWRTVGENIAAGRTTAADTVTDWLNSPGHCRNIMNPAFFEVAVSCAEDVNSQYERYWTNVLAAPR